MERFREKEISYVLLSPRIDSIPESIAYRDQMQGEVPWKEYFRYEDGRLRLYDAFARFVRDRLLSETKYGDAKRVFCERIYLPTSPVWAD